MRAVVDTNILLSYLLLSPARAKQSTVARIVSAAVSGEYTLLLPEELLTELAEKVRQKPYLARRILAAEAEELASLIQSVAEAIPKIRSPIPAVTRDPKDNYLLAYAVVGEADYLVTGDKDLLVLGEVGGTKIVSPAEFVARLERRGG